MSTYVLVSAAIVVVLLAFILALLVTRRIVEPRRLRHAAAARVRVEPAIYAFVATEGRTPIPPPAGARERAAVREVARDVLLEIEGPERRQLVDCLEALGTVDDVVGDLRSGSRRVRRAAASDLTLMPVASTAGVLADGLRERDATVRVQCARAVVEAGHADLIDEAVRVVEAEPEASARQIGGMMMALVRTGRAASLIEWFGRASSPKTRRTAAAILGTARCREASPLLRERLSSDDPRLRERCARGLGTIGDRAAVPALAELVGSDGEHEAVRAAAASALGLIGGSEAVTALQDALGADSWTVRERAAESLVSLGPEGHAALERALPAAVEPAAAQIRYAVAT